MVHCNYLIQNLVKDRSCANCEHYIQHYTKCGSNYIMCFAGHCTNKRMKAVKPSKVCDDFCDKKGADDARNQSIIR